MNSRFTRGLIIGGVIGASVSMMSNSNMMSNRSRRKLMKNGRSMLRKSSNLIGDVIELFR